MSHFSIFGKLSNKNNLKLLRRVKKYIINFFLREGHQFVRLFKQENIPREDFENESFQYIDRNKLIEYLKKISFNVKDIFKINEIGSDLRLLALLGIFFFYFLSKKINNKT